MLHCILYSRGLTFIIYFHIHYSSTDSRLCKTPNSHLNNTTLPEKGDRLDGYIVILDFIQYTIV